MKLDTYDGLLAMYQLQKANLATYQNQVGATDAEILEVGKAADNLQYMADIADLADAAKRSLTQIKRTLYDGDPNTPIADFGGFPIFAPPHALQAGMEARAQKRNRRYKAGDGYTREIGIALGIETDSRGGGAASNNNEIKPQIDVFGAQTGYHFSIVVSNRAAADMWDVLILRKGATDWAVAKTAGGKSVDVQVAPTHAGDPEQLQVRVQLKKSNQDYGEPSDIMYVTINP